MIKYYKVGDKVRIKSLDWYNENKESIIECVLLTVPFMEPMSKYCGQVATITKVVNGNEYKISLDNGCCNWSGDTFEGLVEEETTPNIIEEEKTYLDNMNTINDERKLMKSFSLKEYLKNPARKVVTRKGNPVRIIYTDAEEDDRFPIVASVLNEYGEEHSFKYTKYGLWSNGESDLDLFFVPIKREGWVNIYNFEENRIGTGDVYLNKEEAIKNIRDKKYIATVKVEWEE